MTDDCRVFQIGPAELGEKLTGCRIIKLARRGKYLVFHLERRYLIVHLGMTGQLTLRHPALPDSPGFFRHPVTGLERIRQHAPDRHTHFQCIFDDGQAMLYRDPRKFGRIFLLSDRDGELDRFFEGLGLEPLSSGYEFEPFLAYLKGRGAPIKAVLLDQRFVAGVGNIYADEALFEAGIHPARRVRYLKKYEKRRLFDAVPWVLRRGIEFGGTSIRDYVNSEGMIGSNQDELNVYGREGLPCHRCGREIMKIVLAQRGTHFCPECQPRRP